jgi:hypothetical protein
MAQAVMLYGPFIQRLADRQEIRGRASDRNSPIGNQVSGVVTLMPGHAMNWYAGWVLFLAAIVTGAGIGLRFHESDFLGGYASFRRRIIRLGHIALAALGMVNVVYAISPWPDRSLWQAKAASIAFLVGAIAMPAVCFLTGWKEGFRHLFFVPVISLGLAVLFVLWGGVP